MTKEARLDYTARAKRDLDSAKLWLTQPGSGRRAHNCYVAILRALLDLRRNPARWAQTEHSGVRKRSVEGWIIMYEYSQNGDQVRILRIFGPYQDRSTL